jgi:hypothetical protein
MLSPASIYPAMDWATLAFVSLWATAAFIAVARGREQEMFGRCGRLVALAP